MLRALLAGAAIAAAIVACSFTGAPLGLGGDGGLHGDAPLGDGTQPPDGGLPVDARADAGAVSDARPPDASLATCTTGACGAAGGTCIGNVCTITGSGSAITCPAGMSCEVDCTQGGSCQNGVTCGLATSCYLRCTAMNACGGSGIDCGAGGCRIDCTVNHACDNQVVVGACTRH